MIVSGWTRRLAPIPGELLTSCLTRNAFAHGSTPYRFLNLFWEHDPIWNRDFDRDPVGLSRNKAAGLKCDWLADIANQLGITRASIEGATLAGWRQPLGEARLRKGGDTPLILAAGVYHRSRTRHALMFCPDCLREGTAYFRKTWRLGFVVACMDHRRRLCDACQHCGASVIPHRSMTNRLSDCHACGRDVAGVELKSLPTVPEGVLQFQKILLSALHRSEGDVPAGPISPKEIFQTTRALVAVSSPAVVEVRLRDVLGLKPIPSESLERRRFEHSRLDIRVSSLETVAAWMRDWPTNFIAGAEAIAASQRTFARSCMSPALAYQVSRLPTRLRAPQRQYVPILEAPALKRLRRVDKHAYRTKRAIRVLAAIGHATR